MNENTEKFYEKEVSAIGEMLALLEPLSGPARDRVLAYVIGALNIGLPSVKHENLNRIERPGVVQADGVTTQFDAVASSPQVDIRSLTDSKKPNSATEVAAIIAYYLSDLAPEEERRNTIGVTELNIYFKQAGRPLPKNQNMTLVNAAAAGYFDRVEVGAYKLNPVGYNLVVHNLPSSSSSTGAQPRTKTRKKSASTKKGEATKLTDNKKRKLEPIKKRPPATKTSTKKTAKK